MILLGELLTENVKKKTTLISSFWTSMIFAVSKQVG